MAAYVPGFQNDLFISFSHVDNSEGWVQAFHDRLGQRLAQLGTPIAIWRDSKLGGADLLSEEIFAQLEGSALLVSIVTPSGIRSNWCQDERQKFEQFAELNGGFRIGNSVRAVKVVKTPLPNDEHRSLFGTLGYEFYARNPQTERFQEFHPESPDFGNRLDDLAQEIQRILSEMRERPAPAPSKPAVYVAAVTADLEQQRRQVIQEIESWGYEVEPKDSLPPDGLFRPAVEAALAGCILSVHLVSSQRGGIPDTEERSIVALQYELAQSQQRERIVWILPGSTPSPAVLTTLDQGVQEGVERLEGRTLEELKEVIGAKLKRLGGETSLRGNEGRRINIYLVCDQKDHPYGGNGADQQRALELISYLDNNGFVVWLPPVNVAEEKERRRDHQETLRLSQAVILYWGEADELWFRENLRELSKARTRRSSRRFLAEAIYFSRPPRGEKAQYRRHLHLVFEQFNGFRSDALRPLLERLREADEVLSP